MVEKIEKAGSGQMAIGDDRGPSLGLGRLVVALFWIFGILTTGLAVADLFSQPRQIGQNLIALAAGTIYLLVAVGITHNGRRMRIIAWCGLMVSALGPIITGVLGLGEPTDGLHSAWARFGEEYWYVSLLIPLIGFVWMWRSDPRRIVEIAEGIGRAGRR